MGKSTISMAIFNSYVSLPEGKSHFGCLESSFWEQKPWALNPPGGCGGSYLCEPGQEQRGLINSDHLHVHRWGMEFWEFQLWEVRDTMQVLWLNAQYSHFWSVYHLVLPSDRKEDDADLCHDPDILWWKPWVTEQLSLGVNIPRAEVALV